MDVLAPLGLPAATPDERPSLAFLMKSSGQDLSSTVDASARKALSFGDEPPSSTIDLPSTVATTLHIESPGSPADVDDVFAPPTTDPVVCEKPTVSYAKLAALAIAGHPEERASVADIYKWVMDRYPYFRQGKPWWKNCIRHNLSMKKCFVRETQPEGNGSVWTLDPNHRQEILHSTTPRNLSRKRRRPSAPPKLAGRDKSKSKTKASKLPSAPKVSPVLPRPTAVASKLPRRHSIASSSPVPPTRELLDVLDMDIGDLLLNTDELPDPFLPAGQTGATPALFLDLPAVSATDSSHAPGLDRLTSLWSPTPPAGQSLGSQLMMETLDDLSSSKLQAPMEMHSEPDIFHYL
eukprot:m.28942 g.28942  ORF g.28942 m.28942 type:complete len:350 (+) comp11900_c0_seq1:192-1241(+)